MIDHFALLNEPRRPWLDPDSLKRKFLALSAKSHPDRVHNASAVEKRDAQQRYTELNAAYNCLRETKERLLHLLELERGEKPNQVQNIPPELMNLSLEVSGICRQTDAFLAEKAGVSSPVLKVQLFERGHEWTEKLMADQKRVNSWHEHLLAELKAIDAGWNNLAVSDSAARSALLERLEELYRLFSYAARWSAQIQERIVRLSF